MSRFPIVEVSWLDSTSWSGWCDLDVALRRADDEDMKHVTAGYLIADDAKAVTVALSATVEEFERDVLVADVQAIPRKCVLSVTELVPADAGGT